MDDAQSRAHRRVQLSRAYGQAAQEIDSAIRGLAHLVDAGARHMGGHRSGKFWQEDLSELGLGHWEDAPPLSLQEYAAEKQLQKRIQEVLEPQVATAWDLGVGLSEDHPFAA